MSGLALKLIAKAKRSNAKVLDLGNCGLTELPDKLFELTQLEELIISNQYWNYDKKVWIKSKNKGKANRLSQIPEAMGKLEKLIILICGGDENIEWEINDLKAIENLQDLEQLNLSYNQITKIWYLKKLTNLTELNLSYNRIDDIKVLRNLTKLTKLNLFKNAISYIVPLRNLTALTSLYLSNNKVTSIVALGTLSKLTTLYLRSNRITEIKVLAKLTELTLLDLSSNDINKIDGIEALEKLVWLNLNNNRFKNISQLESLSSLESLFLSEVGTSYFSPLEKLTTLKILSLYNNEIADISFLEKMSNLQSLDLGENNFEDISSLENLTYLKSLDLRINQIVDLTPIGKLENIESINLSNNKIDDITSLKGLISLSHLDLRNNQILDISFLKNLKSLKYLDLSKNKISDISKMDNYKTLEHVNLYRNPIEGIFDTSNDTNYIDEVQNYFAIKREKGKVSINLPVKILMLGNHSVGKSVLSNFFIKNEISNTTSTHILEIKPFPEDTKGKLPKAIFFDFGGQDYYHGLYRIFLSKGAVNILLWNNATNKNKLVPDSKGKPTHHFKVNYWLAHKDFRENDYQEDNKDVLFLIKSRIDCEPGSGFFNTKYKVDYQLQLCLAQTKQLKSLPEVTEAMDKSYETGRDHFVALLNATIEKNQAQKVLEKQPQWYLEFLEAIYNKTLIKTKSSLHAVTLNQIIEDTNYKTRQTTAKKGTKAAKTEIYGYLQTQLNQLYQSGLVLYYKEIDTLKDVVWLNPAGVIEEIHNKIFKENLFEKSDTPGVISINELKSKLGLDVKQNAQLIELLKLQKVLFHHNIRITDSEEIDEYIIPNYLPLVDKNDPNYFLTVFGLSQPAFILRFRHFMPMGLINQLVCFFGQQPDRKIFWRDQILFTLNKQARILININLIELSITVSYQLLEDADINKQKLEKYMFKVLLAMYWNYEPLTYEEDKRFSDHNNISNDKTSSVKIYENLEAGLDKVMINQLEKWNLLLKDSPNGISLKPKDLYISIDKKCFVKYADISKTKSNVVEAFPLLEDNTNGNTFNFDKPKLFHKALFNAFMENPVATPQKIFISYSKLDEKAVESGLIPSLRNIERQHKISIWYDKKLQAGDEWDFQIKQQLQEANIILFIVSVNFIATNYIWDVEIEKAIERHDNGEAKVIPIILRPCDWTGSATPFSKLNAVPKKGKPITKFENEDDAWLEVLQHIKEIVV